MSRTIELKWDCGECSTSGILGRHKRCPNCGSPREKGEMQMDGLGADDYDSSGRNKAASVTDPELLRAARTGPDWFCSHCGTGNKGDGDRCSACGAPRYGNADEDHPKFKGDYRKLVDPWKGGYDPEMVALTWDVTEDKPPKEEDLDPEMEALARAANETPRPEYREPFPERPRPELRCSSYYPLLRDRLLQKEHRFITIDEVLTLKDELFSSDLVESESLFFRPDGNDKVFTGGCISLDDFDHGYNLMTFYEPPPESVVVVARPQVIQAEARFLVVGGKVVTGSYYRAGRQSLRLEASSSSLMGIAEDHLDFCLAQGFNPAPSWVLDLAQTAEGWSIIEVGASSACGLYKCDLMSFIRALGPVLMGGSNE